MTVREATDDDIGSIRRVARASWEADYPDILSRESIDEGIDEWYSSDQLEAAVGRSTTLLLVGERDGDVVGFVHGVWSGEEGDILRLYVDPDRRGEGIGRELLERARDTLFEQDVDRIVAMVLEENDPGNAFYRAFGFEQVDTGETTIAGERYRENTYELSRS